MIHFGTSGWRAVIGDEFTFENVRIVTQALANYLKSQNDGPKKILVGYDTRFLSDRFAREAAGVLAGNGFSVLLSDHDVPTPTIAYTICKESLAGGINFTASHNPPEYNGLKFSTAQGAPAPPEVTRAVESAIEKVTSVQIAPPALFDERVKYVDLHPDYLARLRELVDLEVIRKAGLAVGFDALYGTSREYLDHILLQNSVTVTSIHNYLDPYFGGATPNCKAENLLDLKKIVKHKHLDMGMATDGDGDRFGVVSEKGVYVSPNIILALLAWYLTKERGWRLGLGRTVATTHLIDRIARHFDIPVHETPVGFKYLGELFLDGKIHFGGEESAGLSIFDHVPEKDGILANLLVAEMIAREGATLETLIGRLFETFGTLYSGRVDLQLTPDHHAGIPDRLKTIGKSLENFEITKKDARDGVKCYGVDDSWILFRLSGTEPIVRIYAESDKKSKVNRLLTIAETFIKEE